MPSILPDLTAEDYALKEGHHDIAAELKSPSDRMVMSFNEEIVESEKCDTGVTPTRRSVSDASLLSDRHEGEREVRPGPRQMNAPVVQDLPRKAASFEMPCFMGIKKICYQFHKSLPLDGPCS